MMTPPGFRVSPQQERAWDRAGSTGRHNAWAVRVVEIPEPLSAGRLQLCFRDVQNTYEILRTRLALNPEGRLVQVVSDSATGQVEEHDMAEAGLRAGDLLNADRQQLPDACEHAAVVRLYRGRPTSFLWVATSQLLLDADSGEQLIEELARRYVSASVSGTQAEVTQYADYASWIRKRAEATPAADDTSCVAFPPLGSGVTGSGLFEGRLETGEVRQLEQACRESGVELQAWLFTAFAAQLRKLGAEKHFAVNTLVSGRTEPELVGNLGLFALAVRLEPEVEGSRAFVDAVRLNTGLLHRAQQNTYSMRTASRAQCARGATFGFRSIARRESGAGWRVAARCDPPKCGELSVTFTADEESIDILWEYDYSRFDASSVQVLHEAFIAVLRNSLARPKEPLSQHGLLCESDHVTRSHVVRGPEVSLEATPSLITLILSHSHPNERVALVAGDRSVTYAQLATRSLRLAASLADAGVRAGEVVAMVIPRSPEWVVAALAILRLGACYAPLDPQFPPARIEQLLARLRPKLVLRPELLQTLQDSGASVLPHLEPDPTRAAYILHTSGSTGVPKAVEVSERNLLNYIQWAIEAYDVRQIDAAVFHTSPAVDLSVTSVWVPLAAGRTVVIDGPQASVATLSAILEQDQKWLLKATPSHLRALYRYLEIQKKPCTLRGVLVLGGEQLSYKDVAPWIDGESALSAFNEYGPTEATVGCVCARITRSAAREAAVPIGRPISNTELVVVDPDGLALPRGLAGELRVSGAAVTRGYSSESGEGRGFVFDTALEQAAYLTGDRVRVRPDGALEYLGRLDEQIKLQGYRIEPGEVEAALVASGRVAEAAVLKVEHANQGEILVAYCALAAGETLDAMALRAHLRQHLPLYMVPNAFVQIERIPLTVSGKRDLRILVQQYPIRGATFANYAPPRNLVEETLVSVWQHVLRVDRVGVDDDYFALGGDSLRSVQITALAEKRNVRFSLDLLHRCPTIRTLAQQIAATATSPVVHLTQPFELVTPQDRALLPAGVVDAYPLNLLQEGMIYHREFRPKSAVYHAICSYRIVAPFNLALMQAAVRDLVSRHPLLRTSFDLSGFSMPLQLVHAELRDPLRYEDISARSDEQQQQRVDDWMEDEKRRGFEVDEFPLIRFMVHCMGPELFQLSYSFHHEIVDGWSDALMVTELMNHYMSLVNSVPSRPEPPTSTFRDAVHLEQQALQTQHFETFWRHYLDEVNVMRLPSTRPAKADKGERQIIKFDAPVSLELSDKVKALANNLAMPLKSVLLAAHFKVMGMWGGVDDVMTYTVGNGRPENRDGHAVVGLFVNSLAFRLRLRHGSWAQLIQDTLQGEHDLLPYRRYPMAEIKRQHGSEPLSETLFFFNSYHVADSLRHWHNLKLMGLKVYAESTFPYCINAYLEPFTNKLRMRIEYDSLRYSAAVMAEISESYRRVLEAMVANANACHVSSDLMSDEQRARLMQFAAGERRERPPVRTVLDLFATAVAANPQQHAIVGPDGIWSYSELASRCAQLRAELSGRGARPGTSVAVVMSRRPEVVVAMLAVLMTGAAYVPLDAALPVERLQYIVRDSGAVLAITHSADLIEDVGTTCIEIDRIVSARVPDQARETPVTDGVAYIIYTSGTTGRPKGVVCDHAALLNSTLGRNDYYGNPPSSYLLLSSHAFDSSVAGIYWTLCTGGTLVVPGVGSQLEPLEIWRLIARWRVSHLLCIPSLYQAMLSDLEPTTDSSSLRVAIVAGEACSGEVQQLHSKMLPAVTLYNEYGPTEATVWGTVFRCGGGAERAMVPIGVPIPNTAAYVLDYAMNPARADVQGELYLGGLGVAIGYNGNPELTAERFLPDPFSKIPGSRLYRTGDVARMSPAGILEFLGRNDQMIKVQGFRVELAEIERVLERYPGVRRVLAHTHSSAGGAQIIAYVVPEGAEMTLDGLREYARSQLPKYMVPSNFIAIERIPTKVSGKVDHAALPAPKRSTGTPVAPSSPTEKLLADIWRGVLGVDTLGVNQDFFELGGESLRALRIISKTRRAFGYALSLSTLLTQCPTIAKMAEHIDRHVGAEAAAI